MSLKGELSNMFGQRALFHINGSVEYPAAQYAAADVNPEITAAVTPGVDGPGFDKFTI